METATRFRSEFESDQLKVRLETGRTDEALFANEISMLIRDLIKGELNKSARA